MNFEKLGIFIILIGMAIGGWAAYEQRELEAKLSNNALKNLMDLGKGKSLDIFERQVRSAQMEEDVKKLPPYMIGGGALVVLGFGMMYAARGSSDSTRTCPRCAETIQAEAVICKHCRAKLDPINDDHAPDDDDRPSGKRQSYRALAKAAERAERQQKNRQ